MTQEPTILLAGGHIPDACRVVIRGRQQFLTTLADFREVHTENSVRMRRRLVGVIAKLLADSFAGFSIPDLDVTVNGVVAARRNPFSVAGPVNRVNVKPVVMKLFELPSGFQIPDRSRSIPAASDKLLAAWRQSNRVNGSFVIKGANTLRAEVHEPTPFPVSQVRRTVFQNRDGCVEGVLANLGIGQTDPGNVGLILFRLLCEFRFFPFLIGNAFLLDGLFLVVKCDQFLLLSFRFAGNSLLLVFLS